MRTSRLYNQLRDLFGQSIPFADQRHLQTLIWMVVGVICSECINKREMAGLCPHPCPLCPKSSTPLQSVVTQSPHQCTTAIHSPLIAAALVEWGTSSITLIEDTSMLKG
jgi:hypothetical protein